MQKRAKTGVPGLDAILNGGLMRGKSVLLTGGVGTGKTIFGLQFIYKGAKQFNEPGVFVTLQETPQELLDEANLFGWDLQELENDKKIVIIDGTAEKFQTIDKLNEEIQNAVQNINAVRVVYDSVSNLEMAIKNETTIHKSLSRLSDRLRDSKVITIFTSDIIKCKNCRLEYGLDTLTQGLIDLSLIERQGEFHRSLVVKKMRGTAHSLKRFDFEIGAEGIIVQPGG